MMRIPALALVSLAALAGCDGTNPFMIEVESDTGETELVDANDPNTDISNQYLYDPARGLTMNSVEYDAANNELVINNLPFDGPDGRYDAVAGTASTDANGIDREIYESRQTATTGVVKHYAVFVRGDYIEATAANSRDWVDFGYGGANLNRSSFSLPTGIGEYVYRGVYGGQRTFDDRSQIELTAGDAEIFLDVLDFDPLEGIQGAIAGNISNHVALDETGAYDHDLPDIILAVVSFSTDQGVFEDGIASSYLPVTGDPRDSGTFTGLLGGPDGEELGGYTVFEGPGNVQVTTVETIQWTFTDANGTQSGTVSGFDTISATQLQELTNAGANLPSTIPAPTAGIPAGATTITSNETFEYISDYQSREVGVFVTTQQ